MRKGSLTVSFFSSRNEGENLSSPDAAWRYGKGNVFSPAENHIEKGNAIQNQVAIMAQNKLPAGKGVLLRSQYGKGIQVITQEFLDGTGFPKNDAGNIVVAGDGLFTTMTDIPLMNVSGDAHAITFESQHAVGIIVGSWHCIKKEIFGYMVQHFLNDVDVYDPESGCTRKLNPDEITLKIGPGLGENAYTVGENIYSDFKAMYGEEVDTVFHPKPNNANKYIVDFPGLVSFIADHFGIKSIETNHAITTFNKAEWKVVKQQAINLAQEGKIVSATDLLQTYYQYRPYFSARLYGRVERQIRRIEGETDALIRADRATLYAETGRCLNGVMMQSEASLKL